MEERAECGRSASAATKRRNDIKRLGAAKVVTTSLCGTHKDKKRVEDGGNKSNKWVRHQRVGTGAGRGGDEE